MPGIPTSPEVELLLAGLTALDAFCAQMEGTNARLRAVAADRRALLGELGIAGAQLAPAAVPAPTLPGPQAPRLSVQPVADDDPARLEQLRFLESKRAERAALLAAMKGGHDA